MRPNIDDISSGEELKKWYWLKAELAAFCKKTGINYSGSKFDILDRIALSLDAEKVVLEEKSDLDLG
jgi:SAP domain-containing new25